MLLEKFYVYVHLQCTTCDYKPAKSLYSPFFFPFFFSFLSMLKLVHVKYIRRVHSTVSLFTNSFL